MLPLPLDWMFTPFDRASQYPQGRDPNRKPAPNAKIVSIIPLGMGEEATKGKEIPVLFGFGGAPFLDKVSAYAGNVLQPADRSAGGLFP
jgi:hypothetical protein